MDCPDILDRIIRGEELVSILNEFISLSKKLLGLRQLIRIFYDLGNFTTFPIILEAKIDKFSVIHPPLGKDRGRECPNNSFFLFFRRNVDRISGTWFRLNLWLIIFVHNSMFREFKKLKVHILKINILKNFVAVQYLG